MEQKKSVSELISEIKGILEGEFRSVVVEGEISNFSLSTSGHYYFTLKDKDSSISCALFKGDALRNPLTKKIKDGDKLLIFGSISLYAPRGTFQIIVKRIDHSGVGDLKIKFEELKKRLASEGLFDSEHKRKIPLLPKKIAIITALGGAALQDFLNIYNRRSNWGEILIVPSLVQGGDAPKSIVNALNQIDKYNEINLSNPVEVTVLARGGGSLEDLWAFNDEVVARAIFSHGVPTISAIGHQVDFSISDFVADLRTETPSAAAELLTEAQMTLKSRLHKAQRDLNFIVRELLSSSRRKLLKMGPHYLSTQLFERSIQMKKRLERCNLFHRATDLIRIHEYEMRLDDACKEMKVKVDEVLNQNRERLNLTLSILNALAPSRVLERGYSYVTNEAGSVVDNIVEFNKIDERSYLEIAFADGKGRVKRVVL